MKGIEYVEGLENGEFSVFMECSLLSANSTCLRYFSNASFRSPHASA